MEKEKKKPRAKVAISWGAKDIANWKFEEHQLPPPWDKHFGVLPQRFTIYVDGDPGNGKTEYQIQCAKMLAAHFGKVRINNVEQGKHIQIRDSIRRNNLNELKAGKFSYCSINNFEKYKEQLKRPNSGRIQIIDSISFFPLNAKHIQELFDTFKKKSFILVAYKGDYNKNYDIRHLCDLKIRVQNFVATDNGNNRFGGTEDYIIWPERVNKKKNGQLTLVA